MKKYKNINIVDSNLSHAETWKKASIMCGCRVDEGNMYKYYVPPINIWLKNIINFYEDKENSGITVFTDSCLNMSSKYNSNCKIAMILEPPIISGHAYEFVLKNEHLFDYIFTFKKDLLDKNKLKYKFMPADFVTIQDSIHGVSKKNKLISMIYSSMRGSNRDLRHTVAEKMYKNIDLYGSGTADNFLALKSDSLVDYMFSVVIENSSPFDYYYTEKILDCFVLGNVPIYHGTNSIFKFFDSRGIIIWETLKDLEEIINNINVETYYNMMPYININYHLACKYVSADDVMADLINKVINDSHYDTINDFIYKKMEP
jgi:hypothetical protein